MVCSLSKIMFALSALIFLFSEIGLSMDSYHINEKTEVSKEETHFPVPASAHYLLQIDAMATEIAEKNPAYWSQGQDKYKKEVTDRLCSIIAKEKRASVLFAILVGIHDGYSESFSENAHDYIISDLVYWYIVEHLCKIGNDEAYWYFNQLRKIHGDAGASLLFKRYEKQYFSQF